MVGKIREEALNEWVMMEDEDRAKYKEKCHEDDDLAMEIFKEEQYDQIALKYPDLPYQEILNKL